MGRSKKIVLIAVPERRDWALTVRFTKSEKAMLVEDFKASHYESWQEYLHQNTLTWLQYRKQNRIRVMDVAKFTKVKVES